MGSSVYGANTPSLSLLVCELDEKVDVDERNRAAVAESCFEAALFAVMPIEGMGAGDAARGVARLLAGVA